MSNVIVGGTNPPAFQDDQQREYARNGTAAAGDVMRKIIQMANQIAFAGKPIFSWIGTSASTTRDPAFRTVYWGSNYGAVREGARAIYHPANATSAAGQGWRVSVGTTSTTAYINYSGVAAEIYPRGTLASDILTTGGFTASEVKISSLTANGPELHAGCFYQEPQNRADTSTSIISVGYGYTGVQNVGAGLPVYGSSTSFFASEVLQKLTGSLINTWQHRRPQIAWSAIEPGVAPNGYVNFGVAPTSYRYIHDQTMGTGGTAFSETGPAITMPMKYAGAGRLTQFKVYVWVYAAMSGNSHTGSIGIANRDSTGAMSTSATTLFGSPPSISTTTFQWYPAVGVNTAFFLGYCGSAKEFDRIALCAKSSNAAESVRIGAYTMIAIPDV